MPTHDRRSFREILLLLRQRIADAVNLDLAFVVVTLDDDCPHHRGNKDVLLNVGPESPDPMIDGGGRVVNLRQREVEVVCRLRRALDRSDADLIRLSDETFGFLAFEDAVVDAVELWLAEDAVQNVVSLPTPVGHVSKPKRDSEDATWVSSRFTLTIPYVRALTLEGV